MSNVRPRETGLPFTVYISEKGRARHAARVKVAAGERAPPFVASVTVSPNVRVAAGKLDTESLRLVTQWVELNRQALLDHWNGVTSSQEALAALQRMPQP